MTPRIEAAVRLALGLSLALAGFLKLAPAVVFVETIANFRILPPQMNQLLGVVLPWWELVCGVLLLAGLWPRASALVSLLLFGMFTIGVGLALLRGLDIRCGCFNSSSGARADWSALFLDTCGLIASVVVMIHTTRDDSHSKTLRHPIPSDAASSGV